MITYFVKKESIDVQSIEKEIDALEKSIERRQNLLNNPNYTAKAPANIVEMDRIKLKEEEEKLKLLREKIN